MGGLERGGGEGGGRVCVWGGGVIWMGEGWEGVVHVRMVRTMSRGVHGCRRLTKFR